MLRRLTRYIKKRKKVTEYSWMEINSGVFKGHTLYLPKDWGYKVIGEEHEAEIFKTIRTTVGSNKVFYDIGSHYGWFSIAWLCAGGKFVESFEPSLENGEIIKKTVEKNNFSPCIKLHGFALGDKTMNSKLFLFPGDSSRNFIKDSNVKIKENNFNHLEDVQLKTVDNLYYNESLRKPDLIKIDVEGFEYKVLKGAKCLLTELKPKVVVEIHDVENGLLVSDFMSKIGYSMKILGHKGRNKNLPLVLWS